MSEELKKVFDEAATACRLRMKADGALSCHVYEDGPDRIIYSIEPHDDHVEHHISVTRNRQSVNNRVLKHYAEKLIPEFHQYVWTEATLKNGVSHGWWKRRVDYEANRTDDRR